MGKAKILIVEDEVIIGLDIQKKLTDMGYVVSGIADTGDSAIKMIRNDQPDIVLMDIVIKNDKDGIETAEEILNQFNIPVIFLTAYSDEETIQRAKISEPYGYIIKPFKERELRVIIEISLYKHRINIELMEKTRQLEELNKNLELKVAERTKALQEEIEDRKKIENILRQNEENFKDMTEFLPVILVEYDLNLKIQYVNQAGYESFGYTKEDVQKGITILDVSFPEERERVHQNTKMLFEGKRMPLRHYKLKKKDGNAMNTLIDSSPVYRNGKLTGGRSVLIDIKPFFFSYILPDDSFFKEYSFTQREKEILIHLAQGRKYKEIAEQLFISENTLKTHMSNIYDKMGAGNRDEIFDIIKEFQLKHIGRDRLFLSILSMLIQD